MILLPTLDRPKLVRRFFESYRATDADVAGYLLVDEADLLANEEAYHEIRIKDLPGDWILRNTGKAVSMGDKCRFIWPEITHMKWVGILNDDHVCITPEWDKKTEALLDGTNMVSTNDGGWNFGFRCCGLTAWSMPLLDACGFPIFPRNLHHYFIDDVWKAIGEQTGCWLETAKINIAHRHVFKGEMEADDTFRKVNAPEATKYDHGEFEHFMKQDFPEVCKRVLKLRADKQLGEKFL